MKKNVILISLFVFALSMNSCKLLSELTALTKCEFKLQSVDNVRVSGIDLQGKNKISDIKMMDVAKLATSFGSGKLPLDLTFNIEARNPGATTAAISKFQWIALIDNTEIAANTVTKRVEIAPNATSTIPLSISCDLRSFFTKETMNSLINLGINIAGSGNEQSRLAIKIKPTIMLGAIEYPYPGYITLNKTFKAQ